MKCAGSQAYIRLAAELIQRERVFERNGGVTMTTERVQAQWFARFGPRSFGSSRRGCRTGTARRISPYTDVPVAFLKPNPLQPRRHFDEEELAGLAESIARKGRAAANSRAADREATTVMRSLPGSGAGARRNSAKLHDVPVVVREFSDAEVAGDCDHRKCAAQQSQSRRRGRRISGTDRAICLHPGTTWRA